jgi:hypothetical protein
LAEVQHAPFAALFSRTAAYFHTLPLEEMLGGRLLTRASRFPVEKARLLSSSGRARLRVKNEPRKWEEARLLGAQGLEVAHGGRTRLLFASQLEAAAICAAETRPFRLVEARGCRLFSLRTDAKVATLETCTRCVVVLFVVICGYLWFAWDEKGETRLSRSAALAIADRIKKVMPASVALIIAILRLVCLFVV